MTALQLFFTKALAFSVGFEYNENGNVDKNSEYSFDLIDSNGQPLPQTGKTPVAENSEERTNDFVDCDFRSQYIK